MPVITRSKKNAYATLFFLVLLLSPVRTWATSASISVSGNEGAIPLTASASFTKYAYCSPTDPTNCQYVNFGRLYIYHNVSLIHTTQGNGTASWSTTLDGGLLSQGDHTYTAKAVDYEYASDTASAAIHIDNTPTVSLVDPGLVEGTFEITGTADFKEHVYGPEGYLRIYFNGSEQGRFYARKHVHDAQFYVQS